MVAQIKARQPGGPEISIEFIGRPVIKVQVGAYYVYVLIDSDSLFTIINPPEGYTALDNPVFGKYLAGRAAYLKQLTLSGIGEAAITTNRNVTFPHSDQRHPGQDHSPNPAQALPFHAKSHRRAQRLNPQTGRSGVHAKWRQIWGPIQDQRPIP